MGVDCVLTNKHRSAPCQSIAFNFKRGLSMPEFLKQFGTEAQCEAALELFRGVSESNESLNVRRVGSGSRPVDEINGLNDFSIGKSVLPTLAEVCYYPNLAKPAYKKEITFKISKIGVWSVVN